MRRHASLLMVGALAAAGSVHCSNGGSHSVQKEAQVAPPPESEAAPHCTVRIIRCQEIGPAYYRPGCWHAVFKIELQGSPLSLLGRVANKLSRDGPAAPAILASLQREDGTFVALAAEWPTRFGPTMADFPWDVTINWADPCEKAVKVANGDWRIFWKFGLVCDEMPTGRVRVALNGPAILEHLWRGEVAWKSDPTICTVPPLK